MELGPIFRALLHNKARFWLITLEVAFTLAIAANCINMILDLRGSFARPSGYDEENLIVIETEPFAPEFEEEEFLETTREADLARLRVLPGVRDAMAIRAIPMSGGGSSTGRKVLGSKLDNVSAPYFIVTDHAIDTLGLELGEGRAFQPADFDLEMDEDGNIPHRNAILSQALADELFPEGGALGSKIQNREGQITNTIVGIVEHMHNAWPEGNSRADYAMLLPGKPGDSRRMRYMVRTEPGAAAGVLPDLEEVMLGLNPGRLVDVETLLETKRDYYGSSLALIKMLAVVTFLLILVTSLGIVGLTSFSVTERTRQIGTRRALGATKVDIVRYFLVENWIITGIGLVLGVLLAIGLNYGLAQIADAPKLEWPLIVSGVLLLWASGVAAALAPALRATLVSPEVATRTV